MKLILRILINAAALAVADYLLPSLQIQNSLVGLIVTAIVFGLVNAFIRPIVKLFTLPLTCLTLGLFTLVINALMLLLTTWLVNGLSLQGGFFSNLWVAFLGSIIISIVSSLLSWFLPDDKS
jgi:putative membrane protein